MTAAEPSIVVVDDHELIGQSVVLALRGSRLPARRMQVRSEEQILREMAVLPVGVALIDLDLGADDKGRPIDGLPLVGRLAEQGWRVILVTGSRARARIAAAITAGAIGYVPKSTSLNGLIRAVQDTVRGRPIMTENESAHWSEIHRRAQAAQCRAAELLDRLARREREVLDLLARGVRVAVIAEKFVVSEATVRTQVRSIRRKLEVNSQIEAIAIHRAASRQ